MHVFANDGEAMNEWRYFFAIERPLLSSAIYLTTVGNHEYWSGYDAANYFELFALPPMAQNEQQLEQYYAVKYNNTLFIALSTETPIAGAQTTWLENTLDAANVDPEIDWKVVSFHRPAFSSGMHGSEPGVADAWHDLFVQSGVNVVFNGHDHDYERLEVDGVNYLVIGGAGAQLRSFTPGPLDETEYREDMVYHAVVVDVVGQQLTATAYRRDGSEMDGLVLGP